MKQKLIARQHSSLYLYLGLYFFVGCLTPSPELPHLHRFANGATHVANKAIEHISVAYLYDTMNLGTKRIKVKFLFIAISGICLLGYSKAPMAAREQRLNLCVCSLWHRQDSNTRPSALDLFMRTCYALRHRGTYIVNHINWILD